MAPGPPVYNGSMASKKSQSWLVPFFIGVALVAVSRIHLPSALQLTLSIAAVIAFVITLVVAIRAYRSQRSSSS